MKIRVVEKDKREMADKGQTAQKGNKIRKMACGIVYVVAAMTAVFSLSLAVSYIKAGVVMEGDRPKENGEDGVAHDGQKIYEVGEVVDGSLSGRQGEKVTVVGFMCGETGEDVGVCWISDKAFGSVDDGISRVRVRRDELIEYTPYAVAVSGELYYDEEESEWCLYNSSIYTYDGDIERYSFANDVIGTGIVHVVIGTVRNGSYDAEEMEEVRQGLYDIGDAKFIDMLAELKKAADDADEVELNGVYGEFVGLMKEL